MKSGFVSLIGRPNAGKSTLLNNIVGRKVAITSNKPQTTRNLIQGIYNDNETQIVFVDTPGIHKPKHKLGSVLNKQAYFTIDDTDVILYVVDASEKLGNGDKFVIDVLEKTEKHKQAKSSVNSRHQVYKFLALSAHPDLRKKKVLLVDDVYTTGSTIKSSINLIEKLNPKRIEVLVIAKTKPKQIPK